MCVLVTAILLANSACAAEWVGMVEASVLPVPNKDSHAGSPSGARHGYVEYRVQLKNHATAERVVHLTYPNHMMGQGVITTRTVRLAGEQEVSVSLFQPPTGYSWGGIEVRVEGVDESKQLAVEELHGWYDANKGNTVVLLSRSVPQNFRDLPAAKGAAKPSAVPSATSRRGRSTPAVTPSTSSDPYTFLRSELPVRQWSTNWLGYSCYDAIVLSQEEAEQMPADVQLAVRRYIECGGTLLVHGDRLPEAFSEGGKIESDRGYLVGLGRALASGGTDWEDTHRRLTATHVHVYHPEKKPDNLYSMLMGETTVPVRGLFVLVLVFGVAIGPANLWLLSRYKRRIWLWWTVPVISLFTCAAVFGYSLVSEGITGHGRVASLTLLDERSHRATTFGYLSFYCPLTPSEGAHFGIGTDVSLLDLKEDPRRPWARSRDDGLYFIDWTGDQHLKSGWVRARVPAYFQIRKNEDRRERLTVERAADGQVKVVNALGADIERLFLADVSGRILEGRNITAGAEETLSPTDIIPVPDGGVTTIRNIFEGNNWLGAFRGWKDSSARGGMLAPGCYIAYLRTSPFVERPLKGVESEDTVAIVYGISKGQDDGR